jgi:flagellar basal body rod protein FlgG
MDPLTSTVASGLRARLEALDMLANNVANASTAGFKKDSEFYSIFRGELNGQPEADTDMPVVQRNWTDFSQGTLQTTGAPLDFALSGPGWFTVEAPGGPVYTRNGNFQVTAAGAVTTQEGYAVRLAGGQPLRVRAGVPVTLSADGSLSQEGVALGKLEVTEFGDGELSRHGASFFRPVTPGNTGKPARNTEILQGKLENANVSAPESAVRLVGLTRQFESLQRVLQIGGDMNRKSIEELAKV